MFHISWRNPFDHWFLSLLYHTMIARFMGPTWGPSGADRTQVGPMLAPCLNKGRHKCLQIIDKISNGHSFTYRGEIHSVTPTVFLYIKISRSADNGEVSLQKCNKRICKNAMVYIKFKLLLYHISHSNNIPVHSKIEGGFFLRGRKRHIMLAMQPGDHSLLVIWYVIVVPW